LQRYDIHSQFTNSFIGRSGRPNEIVHSTGCV